MAVFLTMKMFLIPWHAHGNQLVLDKTSILSLFVNLWPPIRKVWCDVNFKRLELPIGTSRRAATSISAYRASSSLATINKLGYSAGALYVCVDGTSTSSSAPTSMWPLFIYVYRCCSSPTLRTTYAQAGQSEYPNTTNLMRRMERAHARKSKHVMNY
jgi:hypothetical protein